MASAPDRVALRGAILAAVGAGLIASACAPGQALTGGPLHTVAARTERAASRPASTPATSTTAPPPAPTDIVPLSPGTNPGEGHWVPAGQMSDGIQAVFTTTLTPPGGLPAGVAWINAHAVRTVLYAGTAEPGGSWDNAAAVSQDQRAALIATFNSGFHLGSSEGGWYSDGRAAVPLVDGAASLVVYADGTATVGQWGRDVGPGPAVAQVRQNLHLIVDGGAPSAGLGYDTARWGATFGNAASAWRSGLGVDGGGDLVYVGGPALTPSRLAQLLIAAGAVRAMELDINPEWVCFVSFTGVPGADPTMVAGTKLLDGMSCYWERYLYPNDRDFFAVLSR